MKLMYKQNAFYMSNKNVLILFFSFCSFISFIFVGFHFTKIWIFTLTVQILFDSLEKSHSAAVEK